MFTHPPTTHPGGTKGEIQVEKGDFQGDLFFLGVWTLFGNQPPHPPTFERDLPKKNVFFTPSLMALIEPVDNTALMSLGKW